MWKVINPVDLEGLPVPVPYVRGNRPVALDTTPVKVRGEALYEIWWRGRQWAVTAYGIERSDGTYIIERSRLTEVLADHGWPAHMSRKIWVDSEEFSTCWLVALALHGAKASPAAIRTALSRATVAEPGELA